MLDVRKYRKPKFLKVADFQSGPRSSIDAKDGQYGLDLVVETGDTITANSTSLDNLGLAWGFDAHQWVGCRFEAGFCESPVENPDGSHGQMVMLKPISKPGEQKPIARPKPKEFGTDDSDIPF